MTMDRDPNSKFDADATRVDYGVLVPPVEDTCTENPVLAALFQWGAAVRSATRSRVHARVSVRADADGTYVNGSHARACAQVTIHAAHHPHSGIEVMELQFQLGTGFPAVVHNWDAAEEEFSHISDAEALQRYLATLGWSPRFGQLLRDLSARSREEWRRGAVLDLDIRAYDVEIHLVGEWSMSLLNDFSEVWNSQSKRAERVFETWVASIPRVGDIVHVKVSPDEVVAGIVRAVDHRLGGMHDVAILVDTERGMVG